MIKDAIVFFSGDICARHSCHDLPSRLESYFSERAECIVDGKRAGQAEREDNKAVMQ